MGRANGVGAINSMGCDARGIEYEVAQRASLLLTGDAQETELSCRAVETLELLRNRYGFLPGSGAVREKTAAYMTELIAKLNDLFGTETTDQDQLVYFNNVIKGKLLESKVPGRQAMSNSKEQFANSPDFDLEGTDAIMSALDAHTSMSIKALIQKKCAEE